MESQFKRFRNFRKFELNPTGDHLGAPFFIRLPPPPALRFLTGVYNPNKDGTITLEEFIGNPRIAMSPP